MTEVLGFLLFVKLSFKQIGRVSQLGSCDIEWVHFELLEHLEFVADACDTIEDLLQFTNRKLLESLLTHRLLLEEAVNNLPELPNVLLRLLVVVLVDNIAQVPHANVSHVHQSSECFFFLDSTLQFSDQSV